MSLLFSIFLTELLLQLLHTKVGNGWTGPVWEGTGVPYPELGIVYRPYSTLKTKYPDNPRGYFRTEDRRADMWWLHLDNGCRAKLVLPTENPKQVGIQIVRPARVNGFDIQLNLSHLKIRAGERYTIRFRGRAEQPRQVVLGFAKASAPWSNLGLFTKIELLTEWQVYQKTFVASENETNARMHFDLGGSSASVYFDDVVLLRQVDGRQIRPDIQAPAYFVAYRFNALGCRGPDYAIPRPSSEERILFLGDSYTLGVGVHEEDTVSSKLQLLLNQNSKPSTASRTFKVINCGVSGYATKEERLFYDRFGKRYGAKIVILVMVENDDMSFYDEVRNGYIDRPLGKSEMLFHLWGKIQDYRHRRPVPDFHQSVKELLMLRRSVEGEGARLAVVIFRNYAVRSDEDETARLWNRLTATVMKGLQGKGVPVLDLGKALHSKYSYEDLLVDKNIDAHPNEIADAIASEEILKFLRGHAWL